MVKNVMQCCYTNLSEESSGKISSGWQSVAVSDSIPPDAYRACVSMQNRNSAMQASMTDERGGVLDLLEICGDGKYLYMIRSRYGMADRLGRPNMFSHAYIFSWAENSALIEPNEFLTIADSNFKSSRTDAEKPYDSFERLPLFDIWRAIDMSGMELMTVGSFIQCIYAQMTEKGISEPLYVQYDGTDSQARSLIYCMYALLPHYLRKTLKSACAGGITERDKNVVFSVNASSHEYFFDPRTGENNVLTDKLRKKFTRLAYIDYAVRKYICAEVFIRSKGQNKSNTDTDIRNYFLMLDRIAASLGDPTASNELLLKISNRMIENQPLAVNVSTYDDEKLIMDICDTLRAAACNSSWMMYMEYYIFLLLDESSKRGLSLTLTNENKQTLLRWIDLPQCKRLNQEKIRFRRVIKE